jgi:uncharacterized surface protein with fasciclin (FAS1) repeats
MLRKQLLALYALFMLVAACSKKDKGGDDTPPLNENVESAQDYLLKTDSVKTFGQAFQAVTFADADVSTGITIFAPVNSAISGYDPNARVEATTLTENEVKDHIVKGIIKLIDLTNGKKLTTLSGKELVVTVDGDKILINGVAVLNNTSDTSKAIIYTISNVLCNKPGAAEITVFDGTQWSTTDTLGKTVADANVTLYYSIDGYTNNAQPAATGKTTASGNITFSGLPAGTYYMIVNKDDKSNFIAEVTQGGYKIAYKPVGIFQNTSQINAVPHLPGTVVPGDFIYQDTNGDGTVDENDRTYIPAEVVINSNKTVQVTSFIGYLYNSAGARFTSKADAQTFLDQIYVKIGNWHHQQIATDAVLSDDAGCENLSMCHLNNFNITPVDGHIVSLWYAAYNTIPSLNRLILNVPALNLPAAESNNLIAQAKGLRGFIHLQMATYFGALPLQTGIIARNLSRSPLTETYQFIKNDLTEAMGILPNRFTGADHRRISADVCKLLLARIAMAQGDYVKAKQLTGELMQSSTYSLVAVGNIFVSDENAETIWNIHPGINANYASIINESGTKSFCPAVRYAEVLLINSEAGINMGELDATNINLLRVRRQQQPATFTNPAEAMEMMHSTWKAELPREGQRFAKLVKWGKAMAVLAANGFKEYNGLLPIPQPMLDLHPNIFQNPGY